MNSYLGPFCVDFYTLIHSVGQFWENFQLTFSWYAYAPHDEVFVQIAEFWRILGLVIRHMQQVMIKDVQQLPIIRAQGIVYTYTKESENCTLNALNNQWLSQWLSQLLSPSIERAQGRFFVSHLLGGSWMRLREEAYFGTTKHERNGTRMHHTLHVHVMRKVIQGIQVLQLKNSMAYMVCCCKPWQHTAMIVRHSKRACDGVHGIVYAITLNSMTFSLLLSFERTQSYTRCRLRVKGSHIKSLA